jgi:hypothetical protein
LAVGGWWLVVGGWWLLCRRCPAVTVQQSLDSEERKVESNDEKTVIGTAEDSKSLQIIDQLSTINYQLSTINYQLPTTNNN